MALILREVTQQFGGTPIFENLSLDVEEGCFCCIVGPSGCGKSTLLKVIAGLHNTTAGKVTLNNSPVSLDDGEVGFVFQEDALFPWYTVEDNMRFGLRARKIDKHQWDDIIRKNLDKVGLAEYRSYYPKQLSGGMKQRIAIARVMAYNPKLLLMDEPFASLDSFNRNMLQAELIDLWEKEKKTILFVTHNIDEAVFLSERLIIMGAKPGRIKRVLDINLPRPRNRTDTEFCRNRRRILEMIES
ncbi:ABC transporter ATP-binding protein [Phosphitispora fastidiosa]|uniref:ABC transporter ATP-binding protein n=1 Tax=Phosphitispora fastidiosa TaxID=2837202 RepID=UPI001E5D0200|nr:ABC transporter ATP-binding protein [Phosphitispora fastidiosa]MBU7008010.1 NitT/TauT family transport system ATP-binding protein [Phosphitispora fastidiosa]